MNHASDAMGPAARLLHDILDEYEAGARFENPAALDIVVPVDEVRFPFEFGPDGSEALELLYLTIANLEHARAVRVERRRRRRGGETVRIRVGPREVPLAYGLAAASGYRPLRAVLNDLESAVLVLAQNQEDDARVPPWATSYLAKLADALRRCDLGILRIATRQRIRKEETRVIDAVKAFRWIAAGATGWTRDVSQQILGDSTRLDDLSPLLSRMLRDADPKWNGVEAIPPADVLATYEIRRGPPSNEEQDQLETLPPRDGWTIGRRIGRGGQGNVYLAWRASAPNDEFVLKAMRPEIRRRDRTEGSRKARFAAEVQTMQKLNAAGIDGIVRIIDANLSPTDGLPPWFVMPRYRYSLHAHKRLFYGNLRKTLGLISALATTLASIHRMGHAHRDIKASNVFFDDLSHPPILGDFGLAWQQADAAAITAVGETIGPATWRPPEFRAGGVRMDARQSDVYLLGGLLYELLTGGRSFEEPEHDGQFTHERPEYDIALTIASPHVSGVNELLRGMMARDSQRRLPATDVATRLADILSSSK